MIYIKTVLRFFSHPAQDRILCQLCFRSVASRFLLSDLQPGVQHFRPDEGNNLCRVNVLLRQQQRLSVFRLGRGIHPGDQAVHVPLPAYILHVRAVGHGIGGRLFLRRQQDHVQVVPDHHAVGLFDQAFLRVENRLLGVLPAPVLGDHRLVGGDVHFPGVFFHHRAADEHHGGLRRNVDHVALSQHRAPQLIADMLRADPDGLTLLFLADLRNQEALYSDIPRRDCPLTALAGGRNLRLRNVSLVSGDRRRFHIGRVKVRRHHHSVPGVQCLYDLSGDRLCAAGLRPQSTVRRGYAQPAVGRHASPVLAVVCHHVPG